MAGRIPSSPRSALNPYQIGTIPPVAQLQPDLVDQANPPGSIPCARIMPCGPAGNPNIVAAAQSVIKQVSAPSSTVNTTTTTIIQPPAFANPGYGGFWGAGFPLMTPYIYGSGVSGPVASGFPSLWQFCSESSWVISVVAWQNQSNFGGTYGDIGIYDDNLNLVFDTTPQPMDVPNTTPTIVNVTVNLTAGDVYYLASGFSYSGCLIQGFGGGTYLIEMVNAMNQATAVIKAAYGSTPLGLNGALPPNAGTLTTAAGNAAPIPGIFFGV